MVKIPAGEFTLGFAPSSELIPFLSEKTAGLNAQPKQKFFLETLFENYHPIHSCRIDYCDNVICYESHRQYCHNAAYHEPLRDLLTNNRPGYHLNQQIFLSGLNGLLMRDQSYLNCIVGRVCGRIANAQFSLKNYKYELFANDKNNHLN